MKENIGKIKILKQCFRKGVKFILSAETKPKTDEAGSHFIRSVMDTFHGRLIKEE